MNAAAAPKKSSTTMIIVIVAVLLAGCLPCTGILAAVAIPSFISYVRQSKASEAESNLRSLFAGAAAYYEQEQLAPDGSLQTGCTVGPAVTANVPGPEKQLLGLMDPAFEALGFAAYDPVYYQYEIIAGPAHCSHGPNQPLYTFRAHGDLDGDGQRSLYELSVATDQLEEVVRSPGIYMENELE